MGKLELNPLSCSWSLLVLEVSLVSHRGYELLQSLDSSLQLVVTQADTGGPLAQVLMTDQKGSSHEWLFICEQMMRGARSSRVPGLAQSLCLSVKLH